MKKIIFCALALAFQISSAPVSAGIVGDAVTNFFLGSLPPAARQKIEQTMQQNKAAAEAADAVKKKKEEDERWKDYYEKATNKFVPASWQRYDAKGDLENMQDLVRLEQKIDECLFDKFHCPWNPFDGITLEQLKARNIPSAFYLSGVRAEAHFANTNPDSAAELYEKAARLGSAGGIHAYLRVKKSTAPLPGSDPADMALVMDLALRGDSLALKSLAMSTALPLTTPEMKEVPIEKVREVIASGKEWGYYLAGDKFLSYGFSRKPNVPPDPNEDELLGYMRDGAQKGYLISSHQMIARLLHYINRGHASTPQEIARLKILVDEMKKGLQRKDPFALKTLAILKSDAPTSINTYMPCAHNLNTPAVLSTMLRYDFARINTRDYLDSAHCRQLNCYYDDSPRPIGNFPSAQCVADQESLILNNLSQLTGKFNVAAEDSYQSLLAREGNAARDAKYARWCNADKVRCGKYEENVKAYNNYKQELDQCFVEKALLHHPQIMCYDEIGHEPRYPYPGAAEPNF